MRKLTFTVRGPDALMALQTARTFEATANYGRFEPVYDEHTERLTLYLDIPTTEERCVEEIMARTIGKVSSTHVACMAPEGLRIRV
jgi:hypothetical protein